MAAWRGVWRWTAGTFAAAVLLLGLATGLFRLLVPLLPQYQAQLEAWASAALEVPVTLGSYDLRWKLAGPQLEFYDADLWTPDRSERLLHADGGAVRLSLVDLARGRVRVSGLVLRGAQINIERGPDGDWRVLGREVRAVSGTGESSVLPRGRLVLRDATVTIDDSRGPPLRLADVQLELERSDDALRLNGALDLPDQRNGHLQLVLQTLPGEGDRWEAELHGTRFDLGLVTRFVPALRDRLTGGTTDLELSASLDGRRLQEARLVLDADRLDVRDAAGVSYLYDDVAGRFGWHAVEGGWRLSGEDVRIGRRGQPWPRGGFSVQLAEDGRVVTAKADYLRLEDLRPLLAWLPEGELRQRALALAPRGEIEDLEYGRTPEGGALLRAHFTGLAFEPVGGRPGVSGLTGSVRMDGEAGRLELGASNAVATWPELFPAPLPAAEIRGALGWQRQSDGWRVLSEELLVATADLRSRAQLEMTLPADGTSPVLDLQLAVEDANIGGARRYMPARKLPPRVAAWLDRALAAGRVVSATASFRGPVAAFPFDNGEGEFRARVQFDGVKLDYWEGWPAADNIEGVVEFHNTSLSGQVRSADVGGNHIAPALVNIADLREGVIEYTGHSAGDAGAVLAFLRESGLAKRAPLLERGLESSGPSALDLDFSLPVRRLDATRVRASMHLDGATVGMAGLPQRFERVEGTLSYGDAGLQGDDLTALFIGRPVGLTVAPVRADDGRIAATVLDLEGRFDAIDLGAGLDARLGRLLQGSSVYRAQVRMPQDARSLEITVRSDLTGTAIRVPAPVAKTADAALPLDVHARFPEASKVVVDATLGASAHALIEAARDGERWHMTRGAVVLGDGEPVLEDDEGLVVRGQVPAFDLGAWLDFELDEAAGPPVLSFLDLQIDELNAFGQRFDDVHAEVDRGASQWLIRLAGADLRGALIVPRDARADAPIIAKLDALHLAAGGGDTGGEAADPRELMPMRVEVQDFAYGEMRFGKLDLELTPVAGGIAVTRIATEAPSFTIEGKGQWLYTGFAHRSALDFKLHSTDVRETLESLAFGTSIAANEGEIVASVAWAGPPGPRFREQLTGSVGLRVGKGQLESVQPGAGRVFGLLSVTALPRRLALDFRDVFEKGLAFDEIRGDFTLDGGSAYTNNLVLEGPAADVGIVGRTGIVLRDYDQTAVVYANFGATLPVAGAIAGGPAVGAALLLFSEIFKKPLKAMSSSHYRITGTWEDPVVERIDADDATDAVSGGEGVRNAGVGAGEPLAEDR